MKIKKKLSIISSIVLTIFLFSLLAFKNKPSFSQPQDEKNQQEKKDDDQGKKDDDKEKKDDDSVEGIVLDVYVLPDADESFMENLGKKFKQASGTLWKLGEGNFYFKEVKIGDKVDKKTAWKKGVVIIESIDKSITKCPDGSTDYGYVQIGGGPMVLPGKFAVGTFIHEFGHLQFNIRDEYGRRKKCKGCVMTLPIGGRYCDSSNHTSDGADCWSIILKKYPKFKHPNKDFKKSPPAETKVTITNN